MSAPRTKDLVRAVAGHGWPVLVAQLATMSTTVVDTVVAGRSGTLDLAAVGIGAGIYISVMLAFAGIVQGLTPIAAQHFGARRFDQLAASFQQALWLALLLAGIGMALLWWPDWLLRLSSMSAEVESRTRAYLDVLAFALPGTLVYRACGGMLNAIGRPRMLMFFGLANASVHILLAPALAFGWLGHTPLGAQGCAASAAFIISVLALSSLVYLHRSTHSRELSLLRHWQAPQLRKMGELLRVGLPIGMSAFVEMTSFALIALLVAPLGAEAAGAHRVVGSFAGICYMLPLSISIATLALVGQAAGAQDWARVRKTARAGILIGAVASTVLGLALWVSGEMLVRAYTPDPQVQALAIALVGLIAFYQLFDAVQTVAAQALRGLKITAVPMLVHVFCFWVIGLAGGWWLCFRGLAAADIAPLGLAGFWWAAVCSTIFASVAFFGLLRHHLKKLGQPG
ncbi:MAG: MATE family efflux transporter [Moraxellaceae bacterium]|nr:MATE family efflux transporter [Moraxellaceae bacterium]